MRAAAAIGESALTRRSQRRYRSQNCPLGAASCPALQRLRSHLVSRSVASQISLGAAQISLGMRPVMTSTLLADWGQHRTRAGGATARYPAPESENEMGDRRSSRAGWVGAGGRVRAARRRGSVRVRIRSISTPASPIRRLLKVALPYGAAATSLPEDRTTGAKCPDTDAANTRPRAVWLGAA